MAKWINDKKNKLFTSKKSGGSGSTRHTVMPSQYYKSSDKSRIMTHSGIVRGGISDYTFMNSLVGGNKHKKKSYKNKCDKKK